MFDFVRTHTRLMLGLMVLLIFPSFVFFGVQGYTRFTDGSTAAVAEVDGRKITRAEWDQAHQRGVERLRRQMPNVDSALLESAEARRQTLDGIVRERVLLAAADKAHLFPSDERLQRMFVSDPQFAPVRNADGTVNRELLAAQGMNSEMFAQQLRTEYGMQSVLAAVGGTALPAGAPVNRALDALLQSREAQVLRFDATAYREKVSPTPAEIEAFYKANAAQFTAPEQARIEYVVLDQETLAKGIAVPEEDLRRYYEENASRFTQAEERRASHILITADKSAPGGERQKAKARAEELLAQARKAPEQFAELARQHSQDPGSAAQGGDLDFFGRGSMVKPFEDAAFAMKVGEISNVVETDFGYHVIRLTGVRGGEKQPFDSVRATIEAEVRKQLGQKRYAEVAEQFTNTVYEQSDSLQPVVDKLKLEKKTATVQRTPAPDATGPLASPKLLQAVFSNDSVQGKRNTDAIEVGPSQLASARIVEHTPARTLPLADVQERVRAQLVAQQAAALAKKEGEARLAQLQAAGADLSSLPPAVQVSRTQLQGVPPKVVDAILRAKADALPAVVGVDLGPQGYAVVRVGKVLPRQPDPAVDATLGQQYTQAWANAETLAYYEALKQRFKVKVNDAAVAAAAAAASAPLR
jgi:peptidyl-prolyl cis-trans isomerase D